MERALKIEYFILLAIVLAFFVVSAFLGLRQYDKACTLAKNLNRTECEYQCLKQKGYWVNTSKPYLYQKGKKALLTCKCLFTKETKNIYVETYRP